jgi:hypothetical protein
VRLFPLLILLLAFALPVHGDERLWSAVVLASNKARPAAPPDELKPIAARLKRLFGYNQFEIIGSDVKPIEENVELTLTPTRTFWFNLKARHSNVKEVRGGCLLNLELYQDKRTLVDSVAMIAPDSPLVFRGPLHARGQILILLQVLP